MKHFVYFNEKHELFVPGNGDAHGLDIVAWFDRSSEAHDFARDMNDGESFEDIILTDMELAEELC